MSEQNMFPKQCGVINPRGQTRSKIILKPIKQGYDYTEHIFILFFEHCSSRNSYRTLLWWPFAPKVNISHFSYSSNYLNYYKSLEVATSSFSARLTSTEHIYRYTTNILSKNIVSFSSNISFQFLQRIRIILQLFSFF